MPSTSSAEDRFSTGRKDVLRSLSLDALEFHLNFFFQIENGRIAGLLSEEKEIYSSLKATAGAEYG